MSENVGKSGAIITHIAKLQFYSKQNARIILKTSTQMILPLYTHHSLIGIPESQQNFFP